MGRYAWLGMSLLLCLLLVGLPDAVWYSRDGGALWLASVVVGLALVGVWLARPGGSGGPQRPGIGELLWIGVPGALLTALFWFRAHAGLYSDWLAGLSLQIPALFGWAWPAILLVLFYRRPGEGWRPGNRRHFSGLLAVALVTGLAGYLIHAITWAAYQSETAWQEASAPKDVHRAVVRPTETPLGLSLLGGPGRLVADPVSVVARHPLSLNEAPLPVSVTGILPLGIHRDVSWRVQGTELVSSDSQVVGVEVNDEGRWQLLPRMPGPAVVTLRNRRAEAHIGVWVVNRDGEYAPFTVMTDRFSLTPGPHREGEGGHLRIQTLKLRNESDQSVAGPLYALFRVEDRRVALSGVNRTRRLNPEGVPYVAVFPRSAGAPRVPVIAPGETVDFEVWVTPILTAEWLHFNVDIVQAWSQP